MSIDIEKLKVAKPPKGKLFLKIKKPEGKKVFAYKLKFLAEPVQKPSKRFTDQKTGQPKIDTIGSVVVMAVINDDEVKVGEEVRVNLSQNSVWQLEKHYPLTDKVFDVMNRGRPKGKTYYDYIWMIEAGELAWSVLARLLVA